MIIIKRISVLLLVACISKSLYADKAAVQKTTKAAVAAFQSASKNSLVSKKLLHQFGDVTSLEQVVETGFASLQNLRDGGVRAAYLNQDGAAAGALRDYAFFGIFDGHGTLGGKITSLLQKELVRRVLLSKEPVRALKKSFADMQEMFNKLPDAQKAGATAVVALVEGAQRLTLAHVGDSRAIVIRRGKVIHATVDHKPNNPLEKERIEKQGGYVVNGRAVDSVHRISYGLARSMGDVSAQGKALTAEPQISDALILQKDDVIVLATDGVWDVLSNEEVAAFIGYSETPQQAAESVVDEARQQRSIDDITALVIYIK